MKPGLFGKKLPPVPTGEGVPVTSALPGDCLIHNGYTTLNPTPNCTRCGKPATEAQSLRWQIRMKGESRHHP